MPAEALTVGGATTCEVDAREPWNATGVLVEQGGVYEVTVLEVTDWRDNTVKADPQEGWTGPVAKVLGFACRALARDPRSPMYALVAARGREGKQFTFVGRHGTVTGSSAQPVELLLFANDWAGKYDNNHGRLKAAIKRIA
ncbi:hypothetical protein [Ramlibacter sp. PS4R-6]|uniref:hypothetical protein n=1 Tax=Ramlibacter sp. PS4R-6 TaxID=3133438 RepID=UPI0030B413E1